MHAISEDGRFFKCKGKIVLNTPYEILTPLGDVIQTCDNELGKIYQKEGKYFIEFKKLIAKNNKVNLAKFIAVMNMKSNYQIKSVH